MKINRVDHFVLYVASIETTCEFYSKALGMHILTFGEGRKALAFGNQKINLHQLGAEFKPHAINPSSGSADFCLISDTPLPDVIEHLDRNNVELDSGPVSRTGATGPIQSIYIRDPDGNLVEISEYI